MVTILINHMALPLRAIFSYHGPVVPTLTQYGYSSAASLFVALSGYMVGMVYLRREKPGKRAIVRAAQLYLLNLLVLALLLLMALAAPASVDRFWNLRPMMEPPFTQIVQFLLLIDAPGFTDVLQLYVVLLAMTPVAIWLIRRSPLLLIACSVGLWGIMQVAGLIWTPNALGNGHSLNPLAWQLTFFLPMVAGTMKLHEQVFDWLERHPRIIFAIWIALAAMGIAYVYDLHTFVPLFYTFTNRLLSAPVWLFHSLLMLGGYAGLLVLLKNVLDRWPFRLLASIGRNSLNVFVASTPLVYLLTLVFGWLGGGVAAYLICVFLLLALSCGIAAWGDRRKQRKTRGKVASPVAATAP